MNLVVIGSGYVGLVSGACFSEMGNKVTCVDINQEKIQKLLKGIVPIYEPGLEVMISKNVKKDNLHFTVDLKEALIGAEVVIIAVGTPVGENGGADLRYVLRAAEEIGREMNGNLIVVNKSTVPVGTADKVKKVIEEELVKRGEKMTFQVVSNPEFLKEGAAIHDFMKPDRVVIGAEDVYAFDKMKELYSPFFRTHDRFITMDVKSAEMTKYASNAMLATRISFMNEIANICERVGADVNLVRLGVGSDSRVGYGFIYPGVGYGGSCFPKDVKALKNTARDFGYEPELINAVENVNNRQKTVVVNKIIKKFGENLQGLLFGVWGLAFKPGTDDMREAPAIYVLRELVKRGAKIKVYDPKAMKEAKEVYLKDLGNIVYCNSKYEVLDKAISLILLTEWKEFRSPDFNQIKKRLEKAIIFDGRNQYNAFNLERRGFEYYQIGK
ncbi:UDP-glucose dehydrogenase family protein [Tenacibaculum maritimum]|uniref:UDP-glucose dehydrogenase family protein n=1 Tax=Tenacibaculum maritimum TaxID=107401 RepID=UPI0012E5C5FB|nr:UDP-glucose/GDP-mannose dehydrogenase family protein [Tenacibaculum maritimum]MCD9581663.1 UDP-glucose/GDP-mannose dehydrogenase family protein [Tenacibaculum maritimum]MCD9636211.1 UDP-glucose/GDP-mannose dehydrogenase family protein [Tenacibaculum maritimum]MDB0612967.1 UDP-glucose/GDP-mannose dehydrogenase family protein [Tenacibaculum maritimum]CAA0189271.1 UDP-glucose 6-dehydrogenase [Tenacibaculum maritimum]CAA0191341.1 UDP-glucose 6-dehydrogenase [Tenacibaculum maritimum]